MVGQTVVGRQQKTQASIILSLLYLSPPHTPKSYSIRKKGMGASNQLFLRTIELDPIWESLWVVCEIKEGPSRSVY